MRRVPRLLPLLLPIPLLCGAADVRIDGRFAPAQAETLLALPTGACQAVVAPDGSLRFADGATLSLAPTKPFALPAGRQRLLDGRTPIVVTTRDGQKLSVELTSFVTPSPPLACIRAVVRNKTGGAIEPVLRLEADKALGPLGGKHIGFARGGDLFALCEIREGKGQVAKADTPKRYVFRREGGGPLPGWGKPRRPCDAGYRNIVAGFSEPATYHLQCKKGGRYLVAVGLCESHWKETGRRICDIVVEGKRVARIDPVAKPHGTDVPFVLTFPAIDRDKDGWIAVTSVAAPGSPDVNSIINVLWLFDEATGKGLKPEDILLGKANRRAACYVDCGGPVEAPGPATLDVRLRLPPNGSATLWLKRPFAPMKAAQAPALAAVDLDKQLAAAQQTWRAAFARSATIQLADPAPTDLLYASLANLLMLRTGQDEGAALSAVALDRMGLHAEAAEVLAALIARQAADRLWHDGGDPWRATGQALWALVSHYELTGDKAWLEAHYKPTLRAAEALISACDLTKWSSHNPLWHFHGIVPATPYRTLAADHWLVHDFWAMTGIRFAARAARALERPNDYKWLDDDLSEYEEALRKTIAASRILGPAAGCLPAAPGQSSQWTFAPCVAALYPVPSPAADGKLLTTTFAYLDKHAVQSLPGGIDGQSPTVDLPLACRYAAARLTRGEADAALAAFVSIANCAPPTAVLPRQAQLTGRPAPATPCAAASASYILLLRDMLVREDGDALHLCPCVPRQWLAKPLTVENLPTVFGPLSFRATLEGGKLVVEPKLQARRQPKRLIVPAPLPRGAARKREVENWRSGRIELAVGN